MRGQGRQRLPFRGEREAGLTRERSPFVSFLHQQPGDRSESSLRTRILAAGGAGVILLGLLLAGYYGFWRERTAPEAPPTAPAAKAAEPESPAAPAPRADREPATGSVEVTAGVEGAAVYLDDQRVGETPYRQDRMAPRRYAVRVEKPGYRPFRGEVRVTAGRRARVAASLALESPVLRVESDVPGASVFVDRRYLGTTPLEARDIAPGAHDITVSAEGYDMYADTIELPAGGSRDLVVRFKEVKLDEAVAVVHKHRMGSCSGRLLATTAGLRYESSDKKDAFSAPFASITEFRADYLEKNLKVKLKGGRTYNFTEPSGNADALYVFYQKVGAATKKTNE